MNDRDITIFAAALRWAEEKHEGQFRKSTIGEVAYFTHCVEVAAILRDHGIEDIDILCAGLLHDIVEDTDVTVADVALKFNDQVANYVEECTTDFPGMTVKQKRALLKEKCKDWSFGARCIKTADGLSNIRSLVTLKPDWHVHTQRGFTDTCCASVQMITVDDGPKPPESLLDAFAVQAGETYEVIEGLEELRRIRKAEEKLARQIKD